MGWGATLGTSGRFTGWNAHQLRCLSVAANGVPGLGAIPLSGQTAPASIQHERRAISASYNFPFGGILSSPDCRTA